MARNERRRTRREQVDGGEASPVRLNSTRRFYTAQGNDGPIRTARALTRAFGAGTQLYEQILDKRNEEGQARAVQEAAAGGERNAEDANKGYNETFDMIEAEHDLATFSRELPELLKQEDWENLTHEEVQAKVDEYFQAQLVGINPDSVYGKNVAVGILKQNAAILDAHRGILREQEQQEYRVKAFENLREELQRDGGIDFDKFAEITKGLDKPKEYFLNSIFDLAEEFGRPDLIDAIPDRFPGSGDPTGKTDANLKDAFDDARNRAEIAKDKILKEQDDKYRTENQTKRAQTHSLHNRMADAGDPAVLALIDAGGERGEVTEENPEGAPALYTRDQQRALYDRFFNGVEGAALTDAASNLYAEGRFIGGTAAERDAAFGAALKQFRASQDSDLSDEEKQQEEIEWIIDRSAANGWLPSPIKDQLTTVPTIATAERYDEAASLAEQIDAHTPGFLQSQLTNKQMMTFDLYRRYKNETGGSTERAVEHLNNHDSSRVDIDRKGVNDAVNDLVDDMDVTTLGTRKLIKDSVEFYVGAGYEPAVAASYARAHVEKRVVKVGDYHYERGGVWGNDPAGAHEWAIENEARHSGLDADDLTIVPVGDGTTFAFKHEDEALPRIDKVFKISELVDDYQRWNAEGEEALLDLYETGDSERMQKAEEQAFRKMHPYLRHAGRNGPELEQQARYRWSQMPKEQRDRLIAAELKRN